MSAEMELSTAEQIRVILDRKKMTVASLAKDLGTSRQNLHNKLERDNLSENEMKAIADAMGVRLRISFEIETTKTTRPPSRKKGSE